MRAHGAPIVLAFVLGCGSSQVESPAPKPASSSAPVAKPAPPPKSPTTKEDFIAVFSAYGPGHEAEVTTAVKTLLEKADQPAFHGDEALGRAVLLGLGRVNFADPKSRQLGLLFGDLLGALAPKGIAKELVAIVSRPNAGGHGVAVKQLTMLQVVVAEVLGVVGDASVVPAMVDRMFVLAATLTSRMDPTTGDERVVASSLTMAVARMLGGSLARIGAPCIPVLVPYVKADLGDPRVKAVAELFAGYVSEGGGARPEFYAELATIVLADVGLPELAVQLAATVKDKATKDDVRRRLLGLLVDLPPTAPVLDAIREGFAATVSPKQRVLVATSTSRTMSPAMTGWLLGIATAKGASTDLADAALGSATWLATKADFPAVTKAYGKQGLARRDPLWTTLEATSTPCDPKTIKDPQQKDLCDESPEGGGRVLFKNVTPTVAEVHAQIAQVLACDKDAQCYLAELKKSAAVVDKMGFTRVTLVGTVAMIRAQKAFWMLATFGAEADLVVLVEFFPSIQSPALRSFGQLTLDHNLAAGTKVAAAIEGLVKKLRTEGSEIAQREAAQLGPIARKLRTRAKNP